MILDLQGGGVCCLLSVFCCLLSVVCCLLLVIGCLLCVRFCGECVVCCEVVNFLEQGFAAKLQTFQCVG